MEKTEIQAWYDRNKDRYAGLVSTMETLIETLLREKRIPYHSVSGRVKDRDSCAEKMTRKIYSSPEEMMDIAGLRIITHTTAEVARVCDLIEREFAVDRENSGDKANDMGVDKVGYLSVHYIVKLRPDRARLCEYSRFEGLRCEIQVRSLLQHAWAEIEHDRSYKFAGVLPKEIQRKFYLVAGTLELMDQEFLALSREIDQYAADVKEQAAQGRLRGIAIDSTSLLQFLDSLFQDCQPEKLAKRFVANSDIIIEELSRFGIQTLQQVEDLLSVRKPRDWLLSISYLGILRDAMILRDPEKYFKLAWNENWGVRRRDFDIWERLGVDLRTVQKYVALDPAEEEDFEPGEEQGVTCGV